MSIAIVLGAAAGIGLLTVLLAFQRKPDKAKGEQRVSLRQFRARGTRAQARRVVMENLMQLVLGVALGGGGWYLTGWPVAAVLGLLAGFLGPRMLQAPKKRQAVADEIEAYSQWTEQIRDLVERQRFAVRGGHPLGRERPGEVAPRRWWT